MKTQQQCTRSSDARGPLCRVVRGTYTRVCMRKPYAVCLCMLTYYIVYIYIQTYARLEDVYTCRRVMYAGHSGALVKDVEIGHKVGTLHTECGCGVYVKMSYDTDDADNARVVSA